MANRKHEFSPEYLRNRFEYDPETGFLFWKKRHPHDFNGKNKEQICHLWNSKYAGKMALNHLSARGYYNGSIKPTTAVAHRVAWAVFYGKHPDGTIDHINGNKLDNRIQNLRDVPQAENAKNTAMSSKNTSGVNGVYYNSQIDRWVAQIAASGKTIAIGSYLSKSDAIVARHAAEKVLGYHENHGRRTNS